ncbi:hypothetical protein BCON_0080g00060 [Botryotinia convoluta]|uniref:Uncharacterized protein n=1 Tax=Botryotinia convoluta TaxID=54673 RepID=A0A4Z1IBD6_9HELO|nr:hypothetical protein BCON_0080g00060 [Botryotinia convoluta]
MGDRGLDQYGLPDDDPIARREAILRRLDAKKDVADPATKKVKLNFTKRPDQATPSVHGVFDDVFNKLPAELRDSTTQKIFHEVKQALDARISASITPSIHTRGESSLPDVQKDISQLPTIVEEDLNPVVAISAPRTGGTPPDDAKGLHQVPRQEVIDLYDGSPIRNGRSTARVAAATLSPGDSPNIKSRKRERFPSVSEIDRKTFQRSQGQKETPRQKSLSPSDTPPQRHHDQGVKVFVMKRIATHMQRACSDIGSNFGIPGIKTGTVNMRADPIERWINRRGLGNDPFLIPYGRMLDSNTCTYIVNEIYTCNGTPSNSRSPI